MTKTQIMLAIDDERVRQERLRQQGKFSHTLASPDIHDNLAVTVLTEELGEVARAIMDGDRANLRDELVQLAACCVAFLERL